MFAYLLLAIICFLGTYYAMPRSIKNLEKNGYIVKDMYKENQPYIPTNAGIILLFTSFIAIALFPLLARIISFFTKISIPNSDLLESHLAILLVVSIYSIYGLVDDLVNIGRKMKLFLPPIFAFPLIGLIHLDTMWLPLFGSISLNSEIIPGIYGDDLFRVIMVPIYVMVVANLVNMHSGYNGLQSGLSIIILVTLSVKSHIDGRLEAIIPVGAFLGAFLAFYQFNKYPSKVFEGNIGSLMFGSLIGSVIVIQQYWWFGFFILIPHTFNFILWMIWLFKIYSEPDKYLNDDGTHQKFGSLDKSGYIVVPNCLTLKWIPNYYFNLNESHSAKIMYSFTILFCFLGLIFI